MACDFALAAFQQFCRIIGIIDPRIVMQKIAPRKNASRLTAGEFLPHVFMKKIIAIITPGLILVLIVVLVILVKHQGVKPNRACFQNHCFDVELAVTSEEMSRGLMFRERLDSDKGMLFIFTEEGRYSFWMKNTLIPLDIIWIGGNKQVVFISGNAQPCQEYSCPSIEPAENAKYVLEINGGMAENIGLKVGDKIDLDLK